MSRALLLFCLLPLLGGCLGKSGTVVEYRLRCVDTDYASLRDCDAWATDVRTFYEVDTDRRIVTRRIGDGPPGHYDRCTVHNLDHWSCAAEVGLPAVEFRQGRRVQGDQDALAMQLGKRVTWFEWWSVWLRERLLG